MNLYLVALSVLLMIFFVSVSGQRPGNYWQDNREQGNNSQGNIRDQGNHFQGNRDQGNQVQGNRGQGNRWQGNRGPGNRQQGQGNESWGQDNSCFCNRSYFPVCGSDGKTYGNQCMAKCEKVDVAHRGRCGTQGPVRI